MGQENQVIDISLYKRKIDMIALLQGIEGLYSADTLSGFKRIVPLAILDGSEMVPLIHKTHNSLRYAECSYFGRVHKQNG